MHRGGACVLGVLIVCLGGCFSGDTERSSSVAHRFRSPSGNLGPDGVLLDIVLVERPLGDHFLNDELWASTDCQVVGLEKKVFLDDNGFRVGQVIGMNPGKLQNLLASERTCLPLRRQVLSTGTSTAVTLGPTLPKCNYRVKTPGGSNDVVLDDGQCAFTIVPTLTDDGRTRLRFTPQILYGAEMADYHVAADRSGFEYQRKRRNKVYDDLSWEVTLSPNQYLIVGTHFDENAPENEPQSLGSQCFLVDNGRTFTQRVLVIRTARGAADQGANEKLPGASTSPAAYCLQPGA